MGKISKYAGNELKECEKFYSLSLLRGLIFHVYVEYYAFNTGRIKVFFRSFVVRRISHRFYPCKTVYLHIRKILKVLPAIIALNPDLLWTGR